MFVHRTLLGQMEKHVNVTQIHARAPVSFLKAYLSAASSSKETQVWWVGGWGDQVMGIKEG